MVVEIVFIGVLVLILLALLYVGSEIKNTEIVCAPTTVDAERVIGGVLDRVEAKKIHASIDFDEKGIHIITASCEEFPEEEVAE